MSRDVIQVGGEDRVVREDTAKAFRGVHWAWYSIAAFVIIAAAVMAFMFLGASTDGSIKSPGTIANTNAAPR